MNTFLKALIKCLSIGILLTILILEISFFIAAKYNYNQSTLLFTIGLFTFMFTLLLSINNEKENRLNLNSIFHPTLALIIEKNNNLIRHNYIPKENLNYIAISISAILLMILSVII